MTYICKTIEEFCQNASRKGSGIKLTKTRIGHARSFLESDHTELARSVFPDCQSVLPFIEIVPMDGTIKTQVDYMISIDGTCFQRSELKEPGLIVDSDAIDDRAREARLHTWILKHH